MAPRRLAPLIAAAVAAATAGWARPALASVASTVAAAASAGKEAGAPAAPAVQQQARWRTLGPNSGCGRTGSALRAASSKRASTIAECQAHCVGACEAVEFNLARGSCALLNSKPREVHIAQDLECALRLDEDYTPVFVMLPLDVVNASGAISDVARLQGMFDELQKADIDGFMVDVWWGYTETSPKVYSFSAYKDLFELARARGWKVQAVTSFHRCGGNVGDACDIPLPSFALAGEGVWYEDAGGVQNREYISLFADEVPISGGRTPLEMYKDWLKAFAAFFKADLGGLIAEVMVGMGPAGELRYPAYPSGRWEFCGVGEFQAFDPHARASLRAAAEGAGHPEWGAPPPVDAVGGYNSHPEETEFFTTGFSTDYGKFFLEWYSSALKAHGRKVLALAREALGEHVILSGKVSGIHWWYDSPSHAAELTTGYYNTNFRNAYAELAEQVFAAQNATLDFTCLEMRNTEQPPECRSNPEGLVTQVVQATAEYGVPFGGENALQRYDIWAYEKIASYKDHLSVFTYLRLTEELVGPDNLARFRNFVSELHGERGRPHDAAGPDSAMATQPPTLRL